MKRAVAIAVLALTVAVAFFAARRLTTRRPEPPSPMWVVKAPAAARLVPASSGVVVFSKSAEGVTAVRFPGREGLALSAADGMIGAGDGVVAVADRATGAIKYYLVDGAGATPSGATPVGTVKIPGVAVAAGDRKGLVAAVVSEGPAPGATAGSPAGAATGPAPAGAAFKLKRVDFRGRLAWEKEFSGIPLAARAWPGGLAVITVLQVKDYPSTTMIAVKDNVAVECKAIPGFARSVEVHLQAGLIISIAGPSVYAHELDGRLVWSVEPGAVPADIAVCEGGVLVACQKENRGGFGGLFVRDSVTMYDRQGARVWRTEVPPGVSRVRAWKEGVLVGGSSGVTALGASGSTQWELKLPSPVKAMEVSNDEFTLYVLTEAGELGAYRLKP
ncbi:MAG: hypothetical protein HPY55_04950 [Firmicutes bacterium]|nr:hypothetical protein [Bacillota bacterium]